MRQPLPQHTLYRLHLSPVLRILFLCPLPQHTLYRLHQIVFPNQAELIRFASAHSIQVASEFFDAYCKAHELCLSTLYTGCIPAINSVHPVPEVFASAHSIQVASREHGGFARPVWLCLSTLYTGCISLNSTFSPVSLSLPQHTLYRLHRCSKSCPG